MLQTKVFKQLPTIFEYIIWFNSFIISYTILPLLGVAFYTATMYFAAAKYL